MDIWLGEEVGNQSFFVKNDTKLYVCTLETINGCVACMCRYDVGLHNGYNWC